MKLLYDYLPIALFFVTYQLADIYTATIVAMLAAVLQVAHFWFKHRRFETMHMVSLVLIATLGGLTLILRDKSFIMWKPTLVNGLFAAAFLLTSLIGNKPLIHRMLGSQIELPTNVWKRLNFLWIAFFLFSGAINIYFVKDFQAAESKLNLAVPKLDQEKVSALNCETDFTDNLQSLCFSVRKKEQNWVRFKLFGMLGLTLIFVIIQGIYLYKYMQPDVEIDNNKT